MPFRYTKKKVALTYAAPVDEQHVWPDKEIAYFAIDYHFSEKGKIIEKYIVAEEEHEDGRLHYHMYLEFNTRLDTTDARYFDIDGMHPNIGDKPGKKQWLEYITKDGNFITNFYEPRMNPYKMALAAAEQGKLKDGLNILKEKCTRDYLLNRRKIISGLIKPYIGERRVTWLHGPTGTGKSHWADLQGAEDADFENNFFSYRGGEVVVFNEVDKMNMPLNKFLKITDKWELYVNIKGEYCPWAAKHIIFTSTEHWSGVFVHSHSEQIERRITECIDTSVEGWMDSLV